MRRISVGATTVLAALGILLSSVSTSSQARRIGRLEVEDINSRAAVAREVLVKLREPLQAPPVQIASDVDPERVELVGRSGILRIRSKSLGAAALLAALSKRADIAYAEPNFVVHAFTEPNDPLFPQLWGFARVEAALAWDTTVGSAANVVAIVDTGIDYTHTDLAPNVWSAPAAFTVTIGGLSITCQAGTHGFNAIARTCDPRDDHNHGTHVSGTIGAAGNNALGVAGVNWIASLMGLKFLDSTGTGTVADAIDAIEFALQAKQAFAATGGANVRILSNSWGGGDFSQALLDQINAANDQEMLFVAAAGNNGLPNDLFPTYPASYNAANVVAVAATTSTDTRAYFSNYGAQSVHLGAPGVNILSTNRDNAYGSSSGTSMAAPHVSGAGALLLSHCLLDTAQLKATLLDSVDPVSSMASTTITGGRLNVRKAVQSCSAPPEVPTGLSAVGGDTQVRLTWAAAGGATSYRVKRSTAPGGPYAVVASNVRTLQYFDTGLTNGTTYYYVVSASNLLGESADSAEASATPRLPADLVVSSFSVPANAAAGLPLVVSVTTRNQGTGTADPSTTGFYISANTAVEPGDIRLNEVQVVPVLAPGTAAAASLSLGIPSDLATGVYYLIAKADAGDVLFENQEGNNTRLRQILVGPDLVVSTLTVPSVATPGAPIAAGYTVQNQGAAPAPASSLRFFWSTNSSLDAADTVLASESVGTLAPDGSTPGQTTLVVPSGATLGTYYVIAEADSSKGIQEARETNNTAARVVRIGGDLVISAFDPPAALGAGASVVLSDTTSNQGGSEVAPSLTHIYLSSDAVLSAADTLLGTRPVTALAAGAPSVGSTPITIPAGTPAGSYYLIAKADGGGSVSETQESNNTSAEGVTIGPDLTAYVTTVTSPVQAGSLTTVRDSATNRGGSDAGPSMTRYYLSVNSALDAGDLLLAEGRPVPALAAGASNSGSASVTIPAGTAPGSYYVIVKADGDGSIAESSETNNTWPRSIRVE